MKPISSRLPASLFRPAPLALVCGVIASAAILVACGGSNDPIAAAPTTTPPVTTPTTPATPGTVVPPTPASRERWTVGDLHVHTFQSDDTQQTTTLDQVLAKAFVTFGLDWTAVSDHLRASNYDNNGNRLASAIPFSRGMAQFQVPRIKELQAAGTYADKTIVSSFEWDMPTHDHANIAILTDTPLSAAALKAANQFEYLFTNRAATDFDAADVTAWSATDTKAFSTHADAMAAIAWLKRNYPDTSYLQINHPSRNVGTYTVAQLREMNDLAPNIMFSIEGMVGNQMEPDRGGYTQASAAVPNPVALTYGGVDYLVATLGGTWDALLSEGRRIWNVADSDYHFKTNGANSSGYAPGEYAKNHLWGDITDPKSLLAAMRSGRVYGTYGDLISALDFNVSSSAGKGEMGASLAARAGETVTVTVRFKSPERNHFEFNLGSGVPANVRPQVDHVDIIAGDITGRELPGTAGYARATNPSTRVVKRLTAADWKLDAEGYYAATYTMAASKSTYFRLRGTNLGVNVAGETANGEPLADLAIKPSVVTDPQTRFNAINARNYGDLWFYSNPVFVTVSGV